MKISLLQENTPTQAKQDAAYGCDRVKPGNAGDVTPDSFSIRKTSNGKATSKQQQIEEYYILRLQTIAENSDSHQNLENLEEAAKWLIENEKVDVLVHLGDDYDDTKILEKFEVKLIRIPGVFSSYYQDPKSQIG